MLVGLGAVSTTFIAGVENVRCGGALPIGSLTQMGTIRLGKRTEKRAPKIREFVPLARLTDLVFAAWDPFPDNAYTAAKKAGVLEPQHLEPVAAFLNGIRPIPAAFDRNYVKRLTGTNVKTGKTKRDLAEQLRADIRTFKKTSGADRLVMIWAASTEVFLTPGPAHQSMEAFERAMEQNDPAIAPSMLYAYAALMENVPFANGAPNLTVDIPVLERLAEERKLPIGGKDFKTGQTMMKTVLAPAFKARMLGLAGWYSTNILGNRDGEVLDDPESFKTKEESKLGVLEYILQPDQYPELYGNVFHKVRINYYPPRGDNKEGGDNIDIFGWLGDPMQNKVDFLVRASLLAAPSAGVTTERAGTRSPSSGGPPTRCRSRSPSCAATRSWRRPSCSISPCSSTAPTGHGSPASRSGCPSTSRARKPPRDSIPSTTCSSNRSS